MSEDPNFKLISGGKKPFDDDANDAEALLGLALMKGFMLLRREQKLQVIQLVNQLASSAGSNDD
jgi:hypothetical protein